MMASMIAIIIAHTDLILVAGAGVVYLVSRVVSRHRDRQR